MVATLSYFDPHINGYVLLALLPLSLQGTAEDRYIRIVYIRAAVPTALEKA